MTINSISEILSVKHIKFYAPCATRCVFGQKIEETDPHISAQHSRPWPVTILENYERKNNRNFVIIYVAPNSIRMAHKFMYLVVQIK